MNQPNPHTKSAALLREGTRHLQSGKTSMALPILEEAYALDSDNFDVALNLSGAYILNGRFKLAAPILEALSEQYGKNPQVWTNLGAAYLGNPVLAQDEQQLRAIGAFEKALQLDPTAHSVAYNIGLIYRNRRDKEMAIRWFRRAVANDPHDKDAASQLRRLEEDSQL